MKIVFLSLLFEREKEDYYKKKTSGRMSNASNTFQYAILDGFYENDVLKNVRLINSLPVGVYRKQYSELFLKREDFLYNGEKIGETIPCINVHILKQFTRYKNAYSELVKFISDNKNEKIFIITYNVYQPYLKACVKAVSKFANVSFCPIITDMPGEFGILPEKGWRRKYLLWQSKKIFKLLSEAEKMVLLTEQMKDVLKIDNNYLVMEGIYSCMDHNNKDNTVIPHDKKVILYTGSLNKVHGIFTLIDAFLELEKKHDDVELWICGGADAADEIKELTKVHSGIKFFGDVSRGESLKMQRSADVLVNPRPAKDEFVKYSFPSKTMEYLASGKPVVMYKLPGIPDEYDAYLNYVEQDSAQGMASTIEKILYGDYEKYLKLALDGKNFILNNKNSKVQTRRIIDFFSKE